MDDPEARMMDCGMWITLCENHVQRVGPFVGILRCGFNPEFRRLFARLHRRCTPMHKDKTAPVGEDVIVTVSTKLSTHRSEIIRFNHLKLNDLFFHSALVANSG
jgi:hypothetical protein